VLGQAAAAAWREGQPRCSGLSMAGAREFARMQAATCGRDDDALMICQDAVSLAQWRLRDLFR